MRTKGTGVVKLNKGFFVFWVFFFAIFLAAADGYSYTITAKAGSGGSLSPAGSVTVDPNAYQTFIITPDPGYSVYEVIVDGVSVTADTYYAFSNVSADHNIVVYFACDASQVKLLSDGSFYDTIIAAYNYAVGSGLTDITLLMAGAVTEDIDFDSGVSVMLEGGYDCSFVDTYGATNLLGSLRIGGDSVTLSKLRIGAQAYCVEGDPDNFPGNTEICDGLDNNCNGQVDDGLPYIDNDGDGYTSPASCGGTADDCNDNNPNIHPGAIEIYGDGVDRDCDGIDLASPADAPCYECHSFAYIFMTNAHANTAPPDGTCAACHTAIVTNILPGHYGQTVRTTSPVDENNMTAGEIIGCTSCHDWHNTDEFDIGGANIVWPRVKAVGIGNETCDTCHIYRAAAHATGTAHNNRLIDSTCGLCHTSDTTTLGSPGTGTLTSDADVDTLHRSDCTLCHAYAGTKIDPAIVAQKIQDGLDGTQITCTDCHIAHHSETTNQVSYNPSVDTSQLSQQGCAVCHYDYDTVNGTSLGLSTWETILVEHDLDGTKDGSWNTCLNCHDYDGNSSPPLVDVQNAIASGNPATCATCHTDKVPNIEHGIPTTGKHAAHYENAGIGSCSTCHTEPPYFQSGIDTNSDGLYDLAETDVCDPCHQDWDPAGLPAAQDYKAGWSDAEFTLECSDCHAEIVDNGDNIPVGGRRAVSDEFPSGNGHAHYGAAFDSASCQVCHDHANHSDGTVNLLDPDGGAGFDFVNVTDITADPDLSNFCANCHDGNGATRLILPLDPLDPFANGNAPPDVATKFMGTLQWYEWYADAEDHCSLPEGSNRPVNSHHDISDADQAFSGAKLECLDCHGAHTSAQSQKVVNPFISKLAWTGTLNEFCLACHGGGHGPTEPAFPAEVTGPAFYTPPPNNIPGESCGTDVVYDCAGDCVAQANVDTALTNGSCDEVSGLNLNCNIFSYDNGACLPVNTPSTLCGTDMYWDCNDNCIDLATLIGNPVVGGDGALENGICDESAGLDLNCAEYNYDYNACNPCTGNDCSYIGGIDSCSYDFNPWYIDLPWTYEAHGGGSKRAWGGYSGAPTVPEMDCVVCHDSHGSYVAGTNEGGNPYMLRDYVDGTQFIDDGVRRLAQWTGPPWETTGTAGAVVITNPTTFDIGPQIGDMLCAKCHATWTAAFTDHATCSGCLTCHSHGALFGAYDWGGEPIESQFCQ